MKLTQIELNNIKDTVNYSNPLVRDFFDTIEAQQQELDRLQRWVSDLQRGTYVNCVYCGHRYGPESETPVSMADVLKEHIEQCPEHPMSKLKQENEKLRNQMIQAARGSAEIVDLAEENIKLLAEAAAMRNVLEGIREHFNTAAVIGASRCLSSIDAALSSDVGKDYHNPDDVEALKKLTDDFAALKSLYDVENETFTEMVQKEKELLKERDEKDTSLERARRGITSIIEQYTIDFTEEELLQLCPRDKVILKYANETLEVLQEALGGDEDGV